MVNYESQKGYDYNKYDNYILGWIEYYAETMGVIMDPQYTKSQIYEETGMGYTASQKNIPVANSDTDIMQVLDIRNGNIYEYIGISLKNFSAITSTGDYKTGSWFWKVNHSTNNEPEPLADSYNKEKKNRCGGIVESLFNTEKDGSGESYTESSKENYYFLDEKWGIIMKKVIAVLIIAVMLFFLSGCAETEYLNLEYVPELAFSNHYKIKEGIFICWNDMIILDEAVYRIEDGTYKKTDENLCDFFNLAELTECGAYGVKQYYNLIITVDNSLKRFLIYDMESMETYSYEVYDAGSLAGYDWYVCNGNIYYEVQEDVNELNRMIICMDILTGENKKIYSLSEDELSQNMTLAYSFMLRADESMLVAVYNGNTEAVNYKKITIGSNRPVEEKLWETDKYMYLYSLQYNEAGAFILGEFYRTEGGKETEVICLKDNGDIALSNILSIYGLLMTDEGYYLCDNSKKSYMMADTKTDDWIAVIDSITFYDYEGEVVKRYYLDSEELRQKGYKLENIIYAGEKIMVFYCNETTGDLQIKYFSLSCKS